MTKEYILHLIIERLFQDLTIVFTAAKTAHEAATHSENIPDNKYDTLGLEASYVAQGQANRAQDLKFALEAYRRLALQEFNEGSPISLTALVTLEADDGSFRKIFIGPLEGGLKVKDDNSEIIVITPGSPLGRGLIGKSVGDRVQTGMRSSGKEYEIVNVC